MVDTKSSHFATDTTRMSDQGLPADEKQIQAREDDTKVTVIEPSEDAEVELMSEKNQRRHEAYLKIAKWWRHIYKVKQETYAQLRASLYTTEKGKPADAPLTSKEKRQDELQGTVAKLDKARNMLMDKIPGLYSNPTHTVLEYNACFFGKRISIGNHHIFEALTLSNRVFVTFQDVTQGKVKQAISYVGYEDKRVKIRGQSGYREFKKLYVGVTRISNRVGATSTKSFPPSAVAVTPYKNLIQLQYREVIRKERQEYIASVTPFVAPVKKERKHSAPKPAQRNSDRTKDSSTSDSVQGTKKTKKSYVLTDYIQFNTKIRVHMEEHFTGSFAEKSKEVSRVS